MLCYWMQALGTHLRLREGGEEEQQLRGSESGAEKRGRREPGLGGGVRKNRRLRWVGERKEPQDLRRGCGRTPGSAE